MATKKTTELRTWDQKLADMAKVSAARASKASTGGNIFGTKNGLLTFDGAAVPDNTIYAVVLEGIAARADYDGYDEKNPNGPRCFALEPEDLEEPMVPSDECFEKQAETCAECPLAKFGSADNGKAQHCKDARRLALVTAGMITGGKFKLSSPADIAKAPLAFLSISPTSIRAYDAYVKLLNSAAHRPPFGVVTRIKLDTPTKLFSFELVDNLPNEHLQPVMDKVEESRAEIRFPFPPYVEPPKVAPKGRGAAAAVPAKRGAKY